MTIPDEEFLSRFSGPARRALESHGITTAEELSAFAEKEVLQFHGIGPGSLPKLRDALKEKRLAFKEK